jgi:hypothetical protein
MKTTRIGHRTERREEYEYLVAESPALRLRKIAAAVLFLAFSIAAVMVLNGCSDNFGPSGFLPTGPEMPAAAEGKLARGHRDAGRVEDRVAAPEAGVKSTGRTPRGISVVNGSNDMYPAVDQAWHDVCGCWKAQLDPQGVRVIIRKPVLHDKQGQGVFRWVDKKLYYGLRQGNTVWVCPDLAALKHEFSHMIGEEKTGHLVDNGSGKCYL